MRRWVALVCLLVAMGALAAPGPAGADGTAVERVLVLSLPRISWAELAEGDTPALDALLADAGVADLSTRAVRRGTRLGDAYVTIGAGTRSVGDAAVDGQALAVDEPYGDDPAGEVFARRTGEEVDGGIVELAITRILVRNGALHYDSEPGALGDALDREGIRRAVIANADTAELAPVEDRYHREAVAALMGSDGWLPEGVVDPTLLTEDPDAPFGVRTDVDAVLDAFRRVWAPPGRAVVLVEASDLERADAYRRFSRQEMRDEHRRQALESADRLVAGLLEQVDPARDAVLVVGPAASRRELHLTVTALRAPGVEPGLLRSATTRRSGFVQTIDVAPTILDLLGVDAPSSMEGRPYEVGRRGGSYEDRVGFLVDANEGAVFRDSMVWPASTLFVVVNVALSAVAIVALAAPGRRWLRDVAAWSALAVLAFVPATFLAGLAPFADWGPTAYWAFLAGVSALLASAYLLAGRRSGLDPVMVGLGALVALLVIDVVTGARLQLNTVFGYTPTVAGRFAGFGNPAYSALAAATVLLAGLVAHRVGGRRGAWLGIGLLGLAVVVDGMPFWGSDVGGVLSMVPAFALASILLLGRRVRARVVALAAAATAVAIGLFGALDLLRPPERRTHLGRLLERIGDEGWDALSTVVVRKGLANLAVLGRSVWTLMVPAVFAFIAYLVYRAPGRLGILRERVPELRASLAGLMVVGVLGFALNDSGITIPGMMLGILNAVLVYLSVTMAPEPAEHPSERVSAAGAVSAPSGAVRP